MKLDVFLVFVWARAALLEDGECDDVTGQSYKRFTYGRRPFFSVAARFLLSDHIYRQHVFSKAHLRDARPTEGQLCHCHTCQWLGR